MRQLGDEEDGQRVYSGQLSLLPLHLNGRSPFAPISEQNRSGRSIFGKLTASSENWPDSTPGRFFSDARTTANPAFREFHLNLAVISHFLTVIPEQDRSMIEALTARAIGYLYRFTPFVTAELLGWQANPIQNGSWRYFRDGASSLTEKFRDELALTLGVPANTLWLVTDSGVLNVVKRAFVGTDGCTALTWREGSRRVSDDLKKGCAWAPVPSAAEKSFESLPNFLAAEDGGCTISQILGHVESEKNGAIFLDLSELLQIAEVASEPPVEICSSIHIVLQLLRNTLKAGIEREVKHDGPQVLRLAQKERAEEAEVARIMQLLLEKVIVGGVIDVKKQPVLVVGKLPNLNEISCDKMLPIRTLTGIGSSGEDYVRRLIDCNGYTLPPNPLLENWSRTGCGLRSILKSLEVPEHSVEFPADISCLVTFANLDDLLEHPSVKAFTSLCCSASETVSVPYLTILPRAIVNLLRGLEQFPIDRTFSEHGLEDLLRFSYNRILSAIQAAVDISNDFLSFLNNIHLIQEELATILAVARPYQHDDFNCVMREKSKLLPQDFCPWIKPVFYLKNSGMRCLELILSGCERQKNQNTESTRTLNVAVQKGCYYEVPLVLSRTNHQCFELEGEHACTVPVSDFRFEVPDGEGLDLFIGDFHHGISTELAAYRPEDLIRQIDLLYDNDLVSERFTVAIDQTIGLPDGAEIQEFLSHNRVRIEEGKLNVAVWRSAQKFDMLGMDNYSGGIMVVVNNDSALVAFNDAVAVADSAGINLQGITHHQKFAYDEMNEYRLAVMDAAKRLGTPQSSENDLGFPEEMFWECGNQSPIQVIRNVDPSNVFLDIRSRFLGEDIGDQLYDRLQEKVAQDSQTFPASFRASFGFSNANISLIGSHLFRFTPGLENDELLRTYRNYFVLWNEILTEIGADYSDSPEAQKRIFDSVVGPAGRQLFKVKEEITRGRKDFRNPRINLELAEAYLAVGNLKRASTRQNRVREAGKVQPSPILQMNR
jgi:hypothetical protein